MAGIVTQSTSLNSFWSICYCLVVLGIQGYTAYRSISRYQESMGRAWTGTQGTPGEMSVHVALIVFSFLFLPLFVIAAFVRVGNYANDGIKLGRDHALNTNMEAVCKKIKKLSLKRLWQHFCPFAQTFHLIAAFLLLLPETLVNAVELQYGYRTTDGVWSSDLDFLFAPDRAHLSDIKGSLNVTEYHNATLFVIPTPRPPPWGWTNKYSLTVAFVNFAAALLAFSVRYSAVFWYTNKVLTFVFASQLFSMSVTSMFGYCGFSVLYKLSYNLDLYKNIHLSLGCAAVTVLYMFGGIIMLLSTMTVFKYGAHYFEEKFKLIERKHHPETYVKQTIIVHSGCHGYIPHSCAMAALILFAACKGPVLYDLVKAYRVTKDGLVLASVVCEVCYMILWIVLWFVLTIKQKWKFRILDYVPLGQPVFMINSGDHIVKNPSFDADNVEMQELNRERPRSHQRESPPGYMEALANLEGSDDAERSQSDDGTEDSETANLNENADLDAPTSISNGGVMRKSKNRKNGGQRVTFDESVRSNTSSEDGSSHGRAPPGSKVIGESKRMNVTVDVHNGVAEHGRGDSQTRQSDVRGDSPHNKMAGNNSANGDIVMRRQNSDKGKETLQREYRNSIRNKCGEYYGNVNNLSSCSDDATSSTVSEPLPTLMSSFRDKVRESSRAANSYKEQEKYMFGNNNSFDKSNLKQSNFNQLDTSNASKRKAIVEGEPGEVSLKLNDIHLDEVDPAVVRQCKRNSSCNSDDSKRTSTSGTSSLALSSDMLPPLVNKSTSRNLVNGTMDSPENTLKDRGKIDFRHPAEKNEYLFPRPLHLAVKKSDIGRRDSANYSLTSSQETSSNDSDHGQGLCSQV